MKAADNIVAPLFEKMLRTIWNPAPSPQTRDLLLPKLMSGEIRLKDAEKALAEVA